MKVEMPIERTLGASTNKTREITSCLESLEKNVSVYDDLINGLSIRLSAVLSSSTPKDVNNKEQARPYETDLAKAIECQSERIASVNEQLKDIMDRIEL
jgi:SMC interacting uncharacterized protein involved in chromosome segregation